jgi:hypothetical protein
MRVNRRLLYVGVFLVAVGGIVVAADLGALDTAALADALRLWPIALIAVGLGLALRRSRVSLSSGLLAAAVPGLVLGGAFAIAPGFVGDCGVRDEPASFAGQQGAFDGPATITVRTGCGAIDVTTAPGSGWQLSGGNTAGRIPSVTSSSRTLEIDSIGGHGWQALEAGRDTWTLALPTSELDSVSFVGNASRTHIALPGARIGSLALTADLSEIVVDASAASITSLSARVNLGVLSIDLPAGSDLTGTLRVGGGQIQICAPAGLGLRVTTRGEASEVTVEGLEQAGPTWQNPEYVSAAHHADLDVRVSFGEVAINPIGGCK